MILAPRLDAVWPMVEPRVQQIIDRFHYNFTTDDVYAECAAQRCWLYTCSDATSFAIVKPQVDRFTEEIAMLVWLGFNLNAKWQDYLQELARGLGAAKIKLHSKRRGFERIGWQIDDIVYSQPVMEVSNGQGK